MAIKWGSTYVTAVKWGNTVCTQVKWGNTVVFPAGGLDGGVLSPPFTNGFRSSADGGSDATPGESETDWSLSNGNLYRSRTSRITKTYDGAMISFCTKDNIGLNSYTSIAVTFDLGDWQGAYNARVDISGQDVGYRYSVTSISSGTTYTLSSYRTAMSSVTSAAKLYITARWYWNNRVVTVTNTFTVSKIILS